MARGNPVDFGDGMKMDDVTASLKSRKKMRGGKGRGKGRKGRKSSGRY